MAFWSQHLRATEGVAFAGVLKSPCCQAPRGLPCGTLGSFGVRLLDFAGAMYSRVVHVLPNLHTEGGWKSYGCVAEDANRILSTAKGERLILVLAHPTLRA